MVCAYGGGDKMTLSDNEIKRLMADIKEQIGMTKHNAKLFIRVACLWLMYHLKKVYYKLT